MAKKTVKIKDVIQFGDLIAVLVVIVGILMAIFLNEIALRLIGACVAILGGLALVMMISQRLTDIVESGKFNIQVPKPNFQMTVVKDSTAKRQTIENFEEGENEPEIGDIEKIPTQMASDEGFRIVSKSDRLKELRSSDTPPAETPVPVLEKVKIQSTVILDAKKDEKIKSDSEEKFENISEFSKPPFESKVAHIEYASEDNKPVKNVAATASKNEATKTIAPVPEPAPKAEPAKIEKQETPVTPKVEVKPEVKKEDIKIEEKVAPAISEEEALIEQIQEIVAKGKIDDQAPVVIEEVIVDNSEDETPVGVHKDIEIKIIKPVEEPTIEMQTVITETEPAIVAEPIVAKVAETAPKVVTEETANVKPDYNKKVLDLPISALMEDDPIIGEEPRKEFEFFMSRVLVAVSSVVNTKTAAVLLVNNEKSQLVLESYVTTAPGAITKRLRIPFGADIVSQIVKNAKPEILSEINPAAELDLIPYYDEQVGISSFVGVPIFYNKQVIGIICADSLEADAYDSATVSFLGQFTKLISALLHSYTEKYDLLHASKTLEAVASFNKAASKAGNSPDSIIEALVQTVAEMFDYSTVGFCARNEDSGEWQITRFATREKDLPYVDFPLSSKSLLLNECVFKGVPYVASPISSAAVRINEKEEALVGGFFMAVPVKSGDNSFGAIYIEGKSLSNLAGIELHILETLADGAGSGLEKAHLYKYLQSGSIIDSQTGIYNFRAFKTRLKEELARAVDFSTPLAVCLFQIDKYASFNPDEYHERNEKIYFHIIDLIEKRLRTYDIFGKAGSGVLAVALIGATSDQAKQWAEKIRNAAAISVIEINQRRFTVTISVGITDGNSGQNTDEVLDAASQALEIAAGKSNTVQVF